VVEFENNNDDSLYLNFFYKENENENETYVDVNKKTSNENVTENKNENLNFSLNVGNKSDRVSVKVTLMAVHYEQVKDYVHSFRYCSKNKKK
jgi:hypothetical protein